MRKFIIAVVVLLGVIFLIARFAEVEAIVATLQRGDWRYLLAAVLLVIIWLWAIAATYKLIFQATGVDEKVEKLLLLSAAANFVNVVAPSVGMSGMAVFLAEARRRGYSTGRVTVAGVLYILLDYAGFLCVLILGLIVLVRRNNLGWVELLATGVLLLTGSIIGGLLYLGTRSAKRLGDALAKGVRFINRLFRPFTHRQYLSEGRAYEFARDANEALQAIRLRRFNLLVPLGMTLANKILLMTVLLLMFLAFDVPLAPGTLVAGFSLGYLFLIVSPTPAGIGFVEGGLTLALHSLAVPLGQAAVVALSYRGITFWLPLMFGAYAFRYVSSASQVEVTP